MALPPGSDCEHALGLLRFIIDLRSGVIDATRPSAAAGGVTGAFYERAFSVNTQRQE